MSNYLPTTYQQFIATSRYSRWRDEDGRRETWPETVKRYFDFFRNRFSEKLDEKGLEELAECEAAVLGLDAMPSMRALMTAGKALERDHTAGYNCLGYETRMLTKEHGIVPIGEAVGPVTVLSSDGEWHAAEVRSFGKQKLFEVKLKFNSNTVKTVFATEGHQWLLEDGRKLTTAQLRQFDRIPFALAPRSVNVDSVDYRRGVQHGLIYGDGTRVLNSCKRTRGYHIRVCSDREDICQWFNEYPSCELEGDPVFMMYDGFAKTHALKQLPPATETEDYMVGFFRGWFAADGHCGKVNSQIAICVGPEEEDWLRSVMPVYGYSFQGAYVLPSETNYGIRNKESRNLKISRSCLTGDDFLISRKRDNFKPLKSHFVVSAVTETGRDEEVFCATVPDTANFVLEGGLVTGNCGYVAVDHPHVFDEILFVLCCGTGVGFSVESSEVSKLPEVPWDIHPSDTVIVVPDSKIGWATSFRELISMLYAGKVPKWDVSRVRPAGTRLKTFGGRASGPGPLVQLFEFVIDVFKGAAGRKLKPVECHDIVCKIAEIVVVGGVRRSALLSLSDLSDVEMRHSKAGKWWEDNVQRALANNSAVYDSKPDIGQFMEELISLFRSGSGERGIFNRHAAKKYISQLPNRDSDWKFGANPCLEILLRSRQFCNLTSVQVAPGDTVTELLRKVRIATVMGTMQSSLTDFRYLGRSWKRNSEEERLLGVSLSGICDNSLMSNPRSKDLPKLLTTLRDHARFTNKRWAGILGIEESTAITCCKPEGTTSQLCDRASGIHPRYSRYYIRTVRADKKDPLAIMMKDQGFPVEDDVTKPESTYVFSFPMKSPDGAVLRDDMTAVEQLELWMVYKKYWADHTISCTVYVRDSEWIEVAAWVYKHFDDISGVSFLPHSNHSYKQAPYQEITKEQYEEALKLIPVDIDWSKLGEYEMDDQTIGTKELSCTSGQCDIL